MPLQINSEGYLLNTLDNRVQGIILPMYDGEVETIEDINIPLYLSISTNNSEDIFISHLNLVIINHQNIVQAHYNNGFMFNLYKIY